MLEFKILQIGLMLHLVLQVYNGFKQRSMKPNKKILCSSIFAFIVIGSILTIINLYSTADFGECGTKRFNPLTIIVIWGNLLNLLVFLISYIILGISQIIKSSITKNTSM